MRHTRHRKVSAIRLLGNGQAEVELTQGKTALIDAADVSLVCGYRWCAVKSRSTYYASTSVFHGGRWITLPMHRLICGLAPGEKVQPDHIDQNGLNNSKSNLRLANHTIQKLNQRVRKDNTSGVIGVHLRPDGQWQARISIAGERMSLGNFSTAKDAIQCQEVARRIVDLMLTKVATSIDRRAA